MEVPGSLRKWFVFHFVADYVFAIPLFIAPVWFLELFGWPCVDPIAARLVAAALFGIGGESLLGRNGDLDSFRTMLRMKVIWSATATVGIGIAMLEGAPSGGWLFFGTFLIFNVLWTTYWLRLRAKD
jgi:hypothetical protein